MTKMWLSLKIVLAIVLVCLAKFGEPLAHRIDDAEWNGFKSKFGNKEYPTASGITEATAKYYYAYNKNLIENYDRQGSSTFKLRINQFSDMRLIHFNALFPKTTPLLESFDDLPLPVAKPPVDYNPITDQGLMLQAADQGTVCNSGWAYATARAVEILAATAMGGDMPDLLSAQNLIDCAGGGTGCRNQVPQQAFDFLAVHSQTILPESLYENKNAQSEPGMCVPPTGATGVNLAKYAIIEDGNDEDLKKYVGTGTPVVIEINPTSFEFMHYGSGVFQPPRVRTSGSHFMTVIGYGNDPDTKLDYWLVQNSFGDKWGENGRIRIIRNSTAYPLAKSAIFPLELA